MNTNPNVLSKRLWLLGSLNYKVVEEINRKTSVILNGNEELSNQPLLEDISNLLSLEWKLDHQIYWLNGRLEKAKQAVKEGVQQ
ncbi:Uncharacterised protein [Candidatus Tiddalikarchaeum anstoanum]|nr:Uncharacterised protein [Candidatus Tiddalikarchaeum anstoanum]